MMIHKCLPLAFTLLLATLVASGCSTAQKTPTPAAAAAAPSAAPATAAAAPSRSEGALTCTSGDETRTLEVVAKDGGCELEYTKAGQKKSVATSHSGTKHCEDVRGKIRGKLEGSGYKCG